MDRAITYRRHADYCASLAYRLAGGPRRVALEREHRDWMKLAEAYERPPSMGPGAQTQAAQA